MVVMPLEISLRQRVKGMTVVELITVILILGILAAAVLPRFIDRGAFDQRGFRDQVISSVRFARQQAIAKRREVCITINTAPPASIVLTFNPSTVPGAACTLPIVSPGSSDPYILTAPVGVTLTASNTGFRFNGLGQPVPNNATSLVVAGTVPINVAIETGHVTN